MDQQEPLVGLQEPLLGQQEPLERVSRSLQWVSSSLYLSIRLVGASSGSVGASSGVIRSPQWVSKSIQWVSRNLYWFILGLLWVGSCFLCVRRTIIYVVVPLGSYSWLMGASNGSVGIGQTIRSVRVSIASIVGQKGHLVGQQTPLVVPIEQQKHVVSRWWLLFLMGQQAPPVCQ